MSEDATQPEQPSDPNAQEIVDLCTVLIETKGFTDESALAVARADVERLCTEHPQNLDVLFQAAYFYWAFDNDPSKAKALLETIAGQDVAYFEANHLLGIINIGEKNFSQAIQNLRETQKYVPPTDIENNRSLDLMLIYCYIQLGDLTNAQEALYYEHHEVFLREQARLWILQAEKNDCDNDAKKDLLERAEKKLFAAREASTRFGSDVPDDIREVRLNIIKTLFNLRLDEVESMIALARSRISLTEDHPAEALSHFSHAENSCRNAEEEAEALQLEIDALAGRKPMATFLPALYFETLENLVVLRRRLNQLSKEFRPHFENGPTLDGNAPEVI